MPYRNLEEFNKGLELLIINLRSSGHIEEADSLALLIHEMPWATKSELLSELAYEFRSMKGDYSPDVAEQLRKCLFFAANHRQILGMG